MLARQEELPPAAPEKAATSLTGAADNIAQPPPIARQGRLDRQILGTALDEINRVASAILTAKLDREKDEVRREVRGTPEQAPRPGPDRQPQHQTAHTPCAPNGRLAHTQSAERSRSA